MIYFAASVALQIICILHLMRTGRNQMWMWIIIIFSVLGCFAYFLIEVLPAHGGNRYIRHAKAQVGSKLAPERELKRAKDALSLADTAANRISVADALADLGRYGEAIPLYRDVLDRSRGEDHGTSFKLAQALFEAGRPAEALTLARALPEAFGSADDRRKLLLARSLGETGATAEAREIFEDVVTRVPGDEARCHYAHLLIACGDRHRAVEILDEVAARAKRLHPVQRAESADMYRWAETQLRQLRGG